MSVGFKLSKIVVVHSLELHEVQTGEILVDLLTSLVNEHAPTLEVVAFNCHSAQEFRSFLEELTYEAANNGVRPLLHVECHGSPSAGIEFKNGSTLDWDEWGELLTQLNIATRFNLLVAVAACYGAHLNGQYSPVRPSPAYCIVAPTEEIDAADAMRGFRTFYSHLLQTGDAGIAAKEIAKIPVSSGQWFSQLAEQWFVYLIENYIKTHLSHDAFDAWARSLSRRSRNLGQACSVGATKRQLLRLNREGLTGKYFDSFFCIEQVPEGMSRFEFTRTRVKKTVDVLRATRQYKI